MATATQREKASSRNVKTGVYLLDPEDVVLYEVLGCRGYRSIKVGTQQVPVIGEVRIAKVSEPLPDDLREELSRGAWCPFEEVIDFEVVVPATMV